MRKLTLSLVDYVTKRGATLMMTSESLGNNGDDAAFWVDGIIKLDNESDWRNLSVTKFRGSDHLSGEHAFKITGNGLVIYPRLRPNNYSRTFEQGILSSGVEGLTSCLMVVLKKEQPA